MQRRSLSNRVLGMKPSGVRKFFALAATMDSCLDLSIGQPDFSVFPELKKSVQNAIENNKNSYTQSAGLPSARAAIRKKYNLSENSSHDVIITSGVMGGLLLSFSSLIDPGDEILIPDPYFVGYKEAITLLGGKAVCFDTYPHFSFTASKVEPLITDRTKAIIVSSPSNPTGYVMTQEEICDLESLCEKYGLYLIFDEIYEAFCYDSTHYRPKLSDNTIILNGLSKSHAMTGWRIGWAIASKELITQFEKVQQFSYVCAPSPFQAIIPEALDYALDTMLEPFRSRREKVYNALSPLLDINKPGGAFYFFPQIKNEAASDFVERVIRKKLLVIPGIVFSEKDTNFRLSYAVSDTILDQALEILCQELA